MSVVRNVLNEIEWNRGFTIPVANSENQNLERTVVQLEKNFDVTKRDLGTTEDRVNIMTEHLKNVRQELSNTQSLLEARRKETDTEHHFNKVSEREIGRLKQELQRLKGELESLHEKKNMQQNKIFEVNNKIEEIKNGLGGQQQGLESWLEESAKRDEDLITLDKYTKQDSAKIQELSLRLERTTRERTEKHKKLDEEQTQTRMTQVELDRVAEEFRKAHAERQMLISQWEKTIHQMQIRDKEMEQLALELQRVKCDLRDREDLIRDKSQQLDNQKLNNEQTELRIAGAERQQAKLHADYREAEKAREMFHSELQALKRTVDKTSADLEVFRFQVQKMKKETVNMESKLNISVDQKNSLEKRLKTASDDHMTAEEVANEMDGMLQENEKYQVLMEVELKKLRDVEFKKAQELADAKRREADLEAAISGGKITHRNSLIRVAKLDADSLKQQEIIYNQDYSLHQIERKLGRLKGETSNEEKMKLEAKVNELQAVLDDRNQTAHLLTNQLKYLTDDVRRTQNQVDTFSKETSTIKEKISDLDLHNETSQKLMKKITTEKNGLMVEFNIIKLEISKLQNYLASKSHEVMSLEKRQMELGAAIKERRHEISLHKEMLQQQLKSCEEERQQVSTELHEKQAKIEKLRKRYEVLMVSMSPPEGEEERSQAYYVIKAAQEKDTLQRKGDELDGKIRKAEREIRAMENTLKVLNSRNEQYRKAFQKVPDDGEDREEKADLDEELNHAKDKLRLKKRILHEVTSDHETMMRNLAELTRDERAYNESIVEKAERHAGVTREVRDQTEKLTRVTKQIERLHKEAKLEPKNPLNMDLTLREMRESSRKFQAQITTVINDYPDLAPTIQMEFSKANIVLKQPLNLMSHRSGSFTGSAGSMSSSTTTSARSLAASSSRSLKSGGGDQQPGPSNAAKKVDLGSQISFEGLPPRTPSVSGSSSARKLPSKTSPKSK